MILACLMLLAAAQADGAPFEGVIRYVGIPWGSTDDVVCQKLHSVALIAEEPDGTPDVNEPAAVWPAALETTADLDRAFYEVPVAASKSYAGINAVGGQVPTRVRCIYWNEPVDGVLTTLEDAEHAPHLGEPRFCGFALDYLDFATAEKAQATYDYIFTTYSSIFGEGCDISAEGLPGHVWYGQENTAVSVRIDGADVFVEYGVTDTMEKIDELVAMAAE